MDDTELRVQLHQIFPGNRLPEKLHYAHAAIFNSCFSDRIAPVLFKLALILTCCARNTNQKGRYPGESNCTNEAVLQAPLRTK